MSEILQFFSEDDHTGLFAGRRRLERVCCREGSFASNIALSLRLGVSALEGLAARGREIGQVFGHRSADIQIEMHDRNSQWPGSSLR